MDRTILAEIRCEAIPWDGTLAPQLRDAWSRLVAVDRQAHIFAYPEWTELACQCGSMVPWQLLVFRQGNETVGLIPLRKRSPWTAENPSIFSPDYAPLLVDPEAEERVFDSLADWMKTTRNIGLLHLGPCSDQRYRELLHRACASRGLYTQERLLSAPFWVPLPSEWKDFLAGQTRSIRKDLRVAEERLHRDFQDITFNLLDSVSPESERAIDDLVRLYRVRWSDQAGGCFFDDEHNTEHFRHLMRWALEEGYALIPHLQVNGEAVAISVVFRCPHRDSIILHVIARDMDALPSYYAPGTFINVRSLQWAIEHGYTSASLGSGKNEFKSALGEERDPSWEVSIARSAHAYRLYSTLERGLHIATRLPVHLAYHLRHPGQRATGV